ncbi:phosphoglycolate phosphatase-like HAD superfamily hydrolase [Nitrobacteraceae bacterium AZCC 1564]
MVKPIDGQVFDLVNLEKEIEAQVHSFLPAREPRSLNVVHARNGVPTRTMPDYVQHCDGATEIGKLSAEAVVREYEAAAKEIEGMGAELIERVKQCETMTKNAFVATEEMKETAARYREEARRIFLEIENCTRMTDEVRKTCNDLKEKIAQPTPTPAA